MNKKRRIHDGIAGALIFFGVLLGYFASPAWLLLSAAVALLMLQSAFTNFALFISLWINS